MIPCIFHNLRNYDGHLIMQGLGKLPDHEISVIPNNMEKYISFSIRRSKEKFPVTLQFVDSFQFLNASLQKLVENLDTSKFSNMRSCISSPHRDILLQKEIYPYEYVSSFSKFEESQVPPRSAFHSSLINEGISEAEYAHAQTVWKSFNFRNLGGYHDLSVKTHLVLIADVFENFRKLILNFYQLDAAHLLTSPGLAWQAALKLTDVKLDLFTDINMDLFIEKGIQGGVSMISHRHSEANHPQCPTYDSSKDSKYITYLDANNLYGYPLALERMIITPDKLSPTVMEILYEIILKPASKSERLVPTWNSKRNYVLHYRNLKLYLSLGLKLNKIHRVMKFTRTCWLKDYIHFNTEQRKHAKTTFERFFKLLNNAVYGKTMENLRHRVKVDILNNKKTAEMLVASPAFHAFTIFDENLVAVQRKLTELTLNRPIQVGFAILELSKVLMYDFHYNVILKKYGDKARLLFTGHRLFVLRNSNQRS
ncbi:hypothetical protein AVEN_231579-1 [Araneus ventricosus]|uniref:DNA-directed DNA polymerase n=1 Tax=Araneus ventricosus TaxID=182803 RepID=A0A4Y2IJ10_ARAVE|nr:hypothetical protein AVEN_231579-1 [Araneus ventricosus]